MTIVWNLIKAFLVGGALCMIGEILLLKTKLTPARILVGYIVAGVFLSAIGVYAPLAQFAGAGASVPLTVAFFFCNARKRHRKFHVFLNRQVRNQIVTLEDEADTLVAIIVPVKVVVFFRGAAISRLMALGTLQ